MLEVRVPREDVNDDTARLGRWLVDPGGEVRAGEPLCELETTKTVYTVPAPAGGVLHVAASEGEELPVGGLLGWIGAPGEKPPARAEPPEERLSTPGGARRATRKAMAYAQRHGIDLTSIPGRGIITLEELRRSHRPALRHLLEEPREWKPPQEERRILLLGGGMAAMQVIDILLHDPLARLVGCLDDDPGLAGRSILGVPVLGETARLGELWREGRFDQAVIAMGTNMPLRIALYERCRRLGIPLGNAVDPSARLNRNVEMGQGNIICSFVHLGVGAVLGDNNFLAAHTSVDHHCRLGSHILLGPGCHLSGTVTVGDNVLCGSGVVVQPNLTIGEGCRIASGSVIIRDIPPRHAVRLYGGTRITAVRSD